MIVVAEVNQYNIYLMVSFSRVVVMVSEQTVKFITLIK